MVEIADRKRNEKIMKPKQPSYNSKHFKNNRYNFFTKNIANNNSKNKKLTYSSSHKTIKKIRYLFSLNCKTKPR